MNKLRFILITLLAAIMASCESDLESTGSGLLGPEEDIFVIADTFELKSRIDTSSAVVSLPDSMLLGELESDYGTVRAQVLTQLTCPEGYAYPQNAVIDSISLFFYYTSWVGDGFSPLSVNVYEIDGKSLSYAKQYQTDIDVDEYCSRTKSILRNRRIVVASEKRDSIRTSSGTYVPMVKMMADSTSAFFKRFASLRTFTTQEDFNRQFKGLMIETDFGSSTMLYVRDVTMGVHYHFSYSKAGKDTTVNDIKMFYANAEVRSVNPMQYIDKSGLLSNLSKDSSSYNYIVGPAGIHTRISLPVKKMERSMRTHLIQGITADGDTVLKRPYVNLAKLQVDVLNVFSGTESKKTRNDWLQPAQYMLLVKESSAERVLKGSEIPSDTCAIVGTLTSDVDSVGNPIYYYSYDLSTMLTQVMRDSVVPEILNMRLIPVNVKTVTSQSTTYISAVTAAQTLSATQIRSAQSGLNLKMVYSGF